MIRPMILWSFIITLTVSVGVFVHKGTTQTEQPIPVQTEFLEPAGPREFTPLSYLYYLGGDNARLLDRIVQCESGWKVDIRNKVGTASGLAQFLDSTWLNTRIRMGKPDPELLLKHDWKEHIETFVWLFNADGSRHWLESKPCWQSYA